MKRAEEVEARTGEVGVRREGGAEAKREGGAGAKTGEGAGVKRGGGAGVGAEMIRRKRRGSDPGMVREESI